ncbi:uncharacterized protein LOC101219573 isoform X1 [Cucumis sativus]|uniref:SANT domain-containing protein n=1 Tax=Cucumis sativus TaxID=3659 RepID=A0A0A0KU04_CUCSA|nr:uncharacterized protein LOC101219573 isoform X1 [Cucumis sativus]XP_031741654.1 uncharacterized protein LOC101219573 isoform X1 [Cucumis sativus]KGN51211.1 hypothetical protein Csa_008125 [Cucumis sativus]
MPPEPLPWDRKDFFKERKHERSEFLGPLPRWRDSSSHGSREFSRWGSGDFRRPPGHGRQGGWHVFSEEYGHGYGPSMSFNNKMLENVSSRPSVSHGDGKYARNGRESRSFSQRDWKGHSWATSNGSTNNGGRMQHDLNYDQRSVHDMLIYPSHSHSDFVNPREKVKGQHDKVDDVNGLGTNQRRDREYSVSSSGWKPLKWTRSGGLSSRTSTSGHSSSKKSIEALDSNDRKSETVSKNASQNFSPSADHAECAMSSLPYDDASARKKPRLGWGEGLAKYEKKKVEVPDGSTAFTNITAESTHSLNSSLIEKGPRGSGFADCTSPATPSSVISGSPPGGDEKSFGKASSDNDVSNFHGSPGSCFQNQYEGTSTVEKLDNFSIANLCSPLIQLLQSNDSISVDSTALSKLLIYKNQISKVLETTESEIDLLENELKGLKSESKGYFSFTLASSSLLVGDKFFEEQNNVANAVATLPVVTSANTISKTMAHSTSDLEEVYADKDRSGRLDVKESVMKEKLTIYGCSVKENIAAYIDNSVPIKSEGVTVHPVANDMYECAEGGDSVSDLILASNKESACKASEALIGMLPTNERKIDIWSTNACSQNQCLVKERFAKRKRLLRFKERVITLKFKAYQSLWKENLHVPPVRKLRAKSQKKHQLSLWTNYSGYQKNRSSIRYRMPSPAGNLNPVSSTEILKHVSMQLSTPQIKQYRRTLKMPALVLDQKDKMGSRFISNNGLVENPCAVEKERAMINPWTSEEKDVFMEKLECFGKDFGKIASFLDHKTTADCVEFYYKNHKSDCFEKTKKLEFGKKVKSSTSNYLMTTGKKWNPETNAASLDMLGAASTMTARAHKYSSSRSGGRTSYHITQFDDGLSERAKGLNGFGNEREKVAADVLAGICGSLSSEAMGSCVTSNFNRGDSSQDLKCKKGVTTVLRQRMTTNVPRYVDNEIFSDESCGEMGPSYWTDGEKSLFIEAVSVYGKNFSVISTHVGSKSTDQCKVFFSKARKCLGLDLICSAKKMPDNGNGHDADRSNGEGGVDTKDAFPCEMVGSRVVDDLPKAVMSISGGESESMNLQSTHQEVNPSSKTCSNAAVDAMVSDDECTRKDGSQSGFDDDCQSVNSANDKNGLIHEQQHVVISDETAKEQDISVLVATSVGNVSDTETKRGNVDASTARGDKADSHATDCPSIPSNSHITSSAKEEQGRHHVRVHSRSLSDSEQSSRNGDIKLFGQILTHSSFVPSSKSGSSENGIKTTEPHHKFKRRLKVNSHGNLSTAKFNCKNSPGQEENTPSRSYGIWDGNQIRTGLLSLPDPTTLLSRYPTFNHLSKPASSPTEQSPSGCKEETSNSNKETQKREVNNSRKEEVVGEMNVEESCCNEGGGGGGS